jgi:hypothetical protein
MSAAAAPFSVFSFPCPINRVRVRDPIRKTFNPFSFAFNFSVICPLSRVLYGSGQVNPSPGHRPFPLRTMAVVTESETTPSVLFLLF